MRKKQLLALATAGAMVLAMAGCTSGGTSTEAPSTDAPEVTEDTTTDDGGQDTTGGDEATGEVSVDFEDGSISFAGVDTVVNPKPDSSALETADYNGSKALKVTPSGSGSVYVGIQADALLGSDASKLKTVELDLAVESQGSAFAAVSGNIYGLVGEKNDQTAESWSIYLENQNPKTVSYTVPDGYSFGEGNYIVVSMESYAGDPANLYIDNIAFKDADGNVLSADTSAEFVVADTGVDRSNLFGLTGAADIEGFAVSADGWAQAGIDLTEDQIAAIDKDTVFEISYSSESGNMWLVFPGAEQGWTRVGVGDADGSGQGYAYLNSSKNIAQVDYDTIASILGDDVSKWGATLQCESDGAWEVYSVKMGKKAPHYTINGGIDIDGFAVSGDGWAQAGVDVSEDVIAALVPGSAIEIEYSSESGEVWLVFPGAEQGWTRVGVGDYDGSGQGYGIFDGSKCIITYETIAEILGDDTSKWGTTLQCEASSAWEVYSVKVGKAVEMKANNKLVDVECAVSGDGWAQAGVDLTEDQVAALVPGSVININYSSESGEIWLVFPGAEQGWTRVGVGDFDGSGQGYAAYDGSHAQVSFDTIAEILGTDTSKWGTTVQCEASSAWEVYGLTIGQTE
ncbi:MAG: hypothetical protein IJ079_01555 [Lachnospiraceae bacterium]|nr:hypothetical protein [Lachnospiraceae bacterium]MBR1569071.1 hypothetical protein [Lachnospiraceae bacterium]